MNKEFTKISKMINELRKVCITQLEKIKKDRGDDKQIESAINFMKSVKFKSVEEFSNEEDLEYYETFISLVLRTRYDKKVVKRIIEILDHIAEYLLSHIDNEIEKGKEPIEGNFVRFNKRASFLIELERMLARILGNVGYLKNTNGANITQVAGAPDYF
ncbi:MAG: hypothetical protein KJ623_03480 [Nanoarchaeota archaeon]|nr:hypothetical protein [Nanoarchaeota archaeon]MBU0962937.1 hypothetical protein [Nanoarchaeota archaeon]